MSDDNKRIIDYDAFNELPPNSWLVVDSEGQGTGKIAPIKIGATYEIQDGAHSFTLVGSNGYSHTVDIPYDSVQMSYDDYDALTELQKMDGTNRFVPDCPTSELEPEIWQRVGRDPLTTDEKTVSKAINELDGRTKAVNGDAFDDTVTYSKGDYCIYDNKMYTYNDNTPSSGAWDSTKWVQTDIQTEFTNIKSNLTHNVTFDYYEKTGTTDNRGLLLLTGLPYNYIPMYVENFSLVTMFFNGSGSTYAPYIQIKNYDNTYYTNQYVTLKIRCMVVDGLTAPT